MKSMRCSELGGACEQIFRAETFEEIAELSKQHGMEMFQSQDEAHLKAMEVMRELMQDPAEMQKWFDGKRKHFEELPEEA